MINFTNQKLASILLAEMIDEDDEDQPGCRRQLVATGGVDQLPLGDNQGHQHSTRYEGRTCW